MFYDLNVPYTTNHVELQRTLAFLAELGYNTVALSHAITGKLPSDLTSPIPNPLPFPTPPGLHILTRLTFHLTSPSATPRFPSLIPHYSLLALRPTSPQTLNIACQAASVSIISLDLCTARLFHLPRKIMAAAVKSGIRFEICYAGGIGNADAPRGAGAEAGMTRRNMIANATALIRATSGKGIIISSEAGRALACRGPWDVGNLSVGWGLSGERGREAVGREARGVVVRARDMKEGWRGVIDVVFGGEKTETSTDKATAAKGKRKADVLEEAKEEDKPVSKREMKRRAKQMRLETEKNAAANKDKATIGKIATAPHTTGAAAKPA